MNWAAHSCLDLVNSTWADHLGTSVDYDRLPLPAFRRWFLRRWNLEPERPLGPEAVELLAEVRTLLRRLLLEWADGRALRRADRDRLDGLLAAAPLQRRVDLAEAGTRLVPATRDADWIAAELAASCLELMATGDRRRLKVCGNDDCSWMFYDDSANRTRRWCNPGICGNLVKVRRFRSRSAAEAGPGRSRSSRPSRPRPTSER